MANNGRAAERRLQRALLKAVDGFGLITRGERVLVALSGGKDSFSLLELLLWLRRRRGGFELEAAHVDVGLSSEAGERLGRFCAERMVPFHLPKSPIARLLEENLEAGRNPCPLCARLRRGILYGLASSLGFSCIALAHHADDLIETLWLNLLFTGQLKSMPARLRSDDGRNTVIRPLALAWEEDTRSYAAWKGFPIGECACPAGGRRPDSQRRQVKELLARLEKEIPGCKRNLLRALSRVDKETLLDARHFGQALAGSRI